MVPYLLGDTQEHCDLLCDLLERVTSILCWKTGCSKALLRLRDLKSIGGASTKLS